MSRFIRMFSLFPLLAVLLVGCGGESEPDQAAGEAPAEPVVWRFALEEVEGSVQDAYAQRFKQLIEERTDGAVQVTVYPYGALGTSTQVTEQVQSGAIEFAFASPGHLGSVVPETQVFNLHFLFSDDNAVNRQVLAESEALYGPLAEAYQEKGLKVLDYVPEGWMVWTANKPITAPEDFQGVKIRTMVSPLLLEVYEAYGANPTPMAYSEVYSGLQLGMIDAQVNPVFAIEEMSFYEVQDYMIFGKQLQFVTSLVTSPQFWQGLSSERQAVVQAVIDELDAYIFELQQEFNQERLDKIKQASDIEIIRLDEAQRAAFRERSLPVREAYVEQAGERGRRILETLQQEIRAAEQAAQAGQPEAAGQ